MPVRMAIIKKLLQILDFFIIRNSCFTVWVSLIWKSETQNSPKSKTFWVPAWYSKEITHWRISDFQIGDAQLVNIMQTFQNPPPTHNNKKNQKSEKPLIPSIADKGYTFRLNIPNLKICHPKFSNQHFLWGSCWCSKCFKFLSIFNFGLLDLACTTCISKRYLYFIAALYTDTHTYTQSHADIHSHMQTYTQPHTHT